MKRYKVLKDVVEGSMRLSEGSMVLGLSYRQMLRLKKRFSAHGIEGIARQKPKEPPNKKVTQKIEDEIVRLRREIYEDFNILHFKDKLAELHRIFLSYESIRKILIRRGLHNPKGKRKVYRRRRRMPKAGLLVQMDSSQHRWIESIEEKWWLIAMIDDADGYVYAEFHPKETTEANMQVIRRYIEKRGVFMALYVDKASHFKTTRHGGTHYNVSLEHEETQIQRALKEIGIEMINANSPQAKGRVERLFRFLQDRLIKEIRIKGIKNYEEANKFLHEEFLPWYNKNYTLEVESEYRRLPEDKNLDLIFSRKYPRKVYKDNTVSFEGKIYQLLPSNGIKNFADRWVEISIPSDGTIHILYQGKDIKYTTITKEQRIQMKEEDILNKREYQEVKQKKRYIPPENHPWRKPWKPPYVTFQIRNNM